MAMVRRIQARIIPFSSWKSSCLCGTTSTLLALSNFPRPLTTERDAVASPSSSGQSVSLKLRDVDPGT